MRKSITRSILEPAFYTHAHAHAHFSSFPPKRLNFFALFFFFFLKKKDIYGPFEAGFTSTQDRIIQALGCDDPSDGYLDGGIDTYTAEQKVAKACNVQIPRWENGNYISLLDQCGGYVSKRSLYLNLLSSWASVYACLLRVVPSHVYFILYLLFSSSSSSSSFPPSPPSPPSFLLLLLLLL